MAVAVVFLNIFCEPWISICEEVWKTFRCF